MNITEVRIEEIYHEEEVKAFVSIVIDGNFTVNNIRIIKSKKGRLFIAMPRRRLQTGRCRDIAYPINSDAWRTMRAQVFAAYYKYLENAYLPRKGVINA